MKERHITVAEDDDGQRLDRWLKKEVSDLPYGLAQKLIRKGAIRVDDKKKKADTRLSAGQVVRIPPVDDPGQSSAIKDKPRRKVTDADAKAIRGMVIYDDGDILALNKPPGLAVQGGTNTQKHIDGMLPVLAAENGVVPRLVHRLDKDTSGILLLARSADMARKLGFIFKDGAVKKLYAAITVPCPEEKEGTITAPLAKSGQDFEKMRLDEEDGKTAITEFRVIEQAGHRCAFTAFWPRTGRTHQIRAHAALIGSPVWGDRKYGGLKDETGEYLLSGPEELSHDLHLHAARIILKHPSTGKVLDISAAFPKKLARSWNSLGFEARLRDDPFSDITIGN